jgi:dTDP-L-rhamnose 4-epimerase
MRKNVLITGGAGFLGSHLADALIARGHHVRLFDNFTPQVHTGTVPDYLNPRAELFRGDINNDAALREALAGIDVVFHLAAAVGVGQSMYQISHYMRANTQGTATLLQALLDLGLPIEKLVVASSMSIYGEGNYLCANCGSVAPAPRSVDQLARQDWEAKCPQCNASLTPLPTTEAKALQCTSIYALSKKDQEEMCLLFGRTYQLPVVALRFFNIYGPRQALSNPYTGVAAIFASRLLNRRAPLIFEDGGQMRDFVSVHDAVQACMRAMETRSADGMGLNVGSGTPISIREVAQALGAALEVDIAAEITGKYRAGDIRHCFADISAARAYLGYEPRVSFENGMKELVNWLRSQESSDHAHAAVQELERYGLTA